MDLSILGFTLSSTPRHWFISKSFKLYIEQFFSIDTVMIPAHILMWDVDIFFQLYYSSTYGVPSVSGIILKSDEILNYLGDL